MSGIDHQPEETWILDPPGMLFLYEQGAFPMDTLTPEGRRIGAYRADPRAVLLPDELRLPRTLARTLRRHDYALTVDRAFDEVVARCAERPGLPEDELWLTPRLVHAYGRLRRWGHARSFEVWRGSELVGGTFGIAVGRSHTLESMFHTGPDAGSAAVLGAALRLRDAGYELLDVQQRTEHTARFGVVEVTDDQFLARLRHAVRGGLRPLPLPVGAGPDDVGELVRRLRPGSSPSAARRSARSVR